MNILGIEMQAWQVLGIIGILLITSEVFVSGFVMLPIGIAFLLTAAVALWVTSWVALLVVLAVLLVVMFWFFQIRLRKLHGKTRAYTNAEGMIGAECVVTEEIPKGGSGYVKLYGDHWQARSFAARTLEKGERVVITKIDGNKVLVEPMN